MINFIMSLLIGMFPDVLYYVLSITKIKNINKHRVLLFILIAIIYICTFMLFRYNFYLYILHGILIYYSLKLVYKSKLNDLFLVSFLYSYYFVDSLLSYMFIDNYFLALVINKIMLFVPLLFINKLRLAYKNYNKMWNRHNDKTLPFKSITLRNISLTIINISIISFNIVLLYILSIV